MDIKNYRQKFKIGLSLTNQTVVNKDTSEPNKNIKIVIEKNLAMKIVKGEAPVDALDPLFITLRPEIKDFIKKVISAHIDKIKNDFFKRMQQGSL